MISYGGSAALGLAYWGAAAHRNHPAAVGQAAAMIAAIMLISAVSQLGYGAVFQRQLPVAGERSASLILRAYLVSSLIAAALGTLYVASGLTHHFLPSSLRWSVVFIVSGMLWTIFALQDSALVGLRAAKWVPVENILYSLAKLAILPLSIWGHGSTGLFLTYMVPVPLAILAVNLFLFRIHLPARRRQNLPTEDLASGRQRWSMAVAQGVSTLLSNASSSLIALIVVARLGGAANSVYYVSFQIVLGPIMFFWSISRSLLVEALHEPGRMARHTRRGLATTVVVLLATWAVAIPLAPDFLLIFGHSYASAGTELLRLQLIALPGIAVVALYSSYAWIDQKLWRLTGRAILSLVVGVVSLELLVSHFGLLAVGYASLATATVEIVFFLPGTWRRVRRELRAPAS